MVRQRLILAFIVLGVAVFILARKGERSTAIVQKSSAISPRSDSSKSSSHSSKINEVEQQTDYSSSFKSQQVMARKEVPSGAIRGASSVNLNELATTQTEKFSFLEGTPWKIWVGVGAYSKEKGKPTSKVIGEVNGYYLVEEQAEHIDVRNFSSSQPLVVIDSRLGIVGIVTGVFSVTLKEGVSPDVLTQASGVKVLNSFPEIRTYFVTASKEPFDLQAFQDSLKNETDVEIVHAEVLSRQYEKN